MSKLSITKEQEAEALARVWNMGCQSLDPELYCRLEEALQLMADNRNISYESIARHQVTLSRKVTHSSDCRTSDSPGCLPGPCDCEQIEAQQKQPEEIEG